MINRQRCHPGIWLPLRSLVSRSENRQEFPKAIISVATLEYIWLPFSTGRDSWFYTSCVFNWLRSLVYTIWLRNSWLRSLVLRKRVPWRGPNLWWRAKNFQTITARLYHLFAKVRSSTSNFHPHDEGWPASDYLMFPAAGSFLKMANRSIACLLRTVLRRATAAAALVPAHVCASELCAAAAPPFSKRAHEEGLGEDDRCCQARFFDEQYFEGCSKQRQLLLITVCISSSSPLTAYLLRTLLP
jgi:hypothetical protein